MAEAPGRARGRARGRSRGPQAAEAKAMQAAAAVAVPATGQQQQQQQQAAAGTGRASHRGGVRGAEKVPGTGEPSQLVPQMAQMQIGGAAAAGGGDGGGTGRGRGVSRGGMRGMDDTVATRPAHIVDKTGISGEPILLCANYFRVDSTPDFAINQYHVDFNPNVEMLGMRKGMMKDHKTAVFRDLPYIFDGMVLWTPVKLEHTVTEVFSERKSDSSKVKLSIKFIHELNTSDPIILQICNLQMRNNFKHLGFQLIQRNYFSYKEGSTIPRHGLEVWPGYTTSIRQHERSVLMCIDLTFKTLRTESVLDLLYQCHHRDPRNFKDLANKQLLGSIVLTRYNNHTYRIDDINWDMNPASTFPKGRDKVPVSFLDYYQQEYNYKVTDMQQPLLVSAPKKRDIRRGITTPFMLIPEFCAMTGLTDEMRSDYNVMKDIAVHTRVNPDKRVEKLLAFCRRVKGNSTIEKEMTDWGMSYANNLVEFKGRVILPETISQQKNKFSYDQSTADWSREMRGFKLENCVPLKNWILICTQKDMPKGDDFVQNMSRVCPPMGIDFSRPNVFTLTDDRTNTFINALRQNLHPGVQLVVIIVPNNRKDRYDAIKKMCCLDFPVASQVIVARTLMKKQMLMSVATKIAIQLNCKLGGEVWTVEIPLKDLMVVGYDSYHDSSKKGRSVGGVVCSTNNALTRYHSRVTFQEQHQEMLDGFCLSLTGGLRRYHEANKKLPDRVIIYRDGVGDGQLAMVKEWELPQIEASFSSIGPEYKPKWTFIVVTKRLNTRIFAKRGPNMTNPPPGTVIDTEITRPERYDFFVVSQSVRQGTVAPTAYNVLHDSSQLRPDHVQRLTYKLTHLYYNWPGTIRVPAPCQYAHKLAFLTGQSLHRAPHTDLADTLFYL